MIRYLHLHLNGKIQRWIAFSLPLFISLSFTTTSSFGILPSVDALASPSPTAASSAVSATQKVSINVLLSTCVDACQRGCLEIRDVERKRQAGEAFAVEFKDSRDPKSALTEADARAQHAIIDSLLQAWGDCLTIVGEEEDEEEENILKQALISDTSEPLRKDLCCNILKDPKVDDIVADLSDITVFVDPVDGTREFVEGRLRNCQALVGIALKGFPVAGVIGVPFPSGVLNAEEQSTIVYGQVGVGYGTIGSKLEPQYPDQSPKRPIMASGDATIAVMVEARTRLIEEQFKGSNQLYGGAGNKILATALGHVDCTVQHKFGGPWDTCAPEAVLESMGGTITDMQGKELVITQRHTSIHWNQMGFVATGANSVVTHEDLIQALKDSKVVQSYLEQGLTYLKSEATDAG